MAFTADANDEVERRGVAPTSNEADLSQSSTPFLAYRRRDPRSLEPIVRPLRWDGQGRTPGRTLFNKTNPPIQSAVVTANQKIEMPIRLVQ
jgi:hypothetical protein